MQIELTFYGVRGTRPVTGERFQKFGGDTSCVGVRVVPGGGAEPLHLLFDGGTGMHVAGQQWAGASHSVAVFLSHLHHDHVGGLAFFAPLFESGRSVRVYVPEGMTPSLREYFAPPYYPLTMEDLPADVSITELPPDASVRWESGMAEGVVSVRNRAGAGDASVIVDSLRLPGQVHPRNGVTLYALEAGNKRIVYASDFEWLRASAVDQTRILQFITDADIFIVDAQYTEDEYRAFAGRGHNTMNTAVELGNRAGARHVVLFHHDPARDDPAMKALETEVQRVSAGTDGAERDKPGPVVEVARQGLRLTLGGQVRKGGNDARSS